MLFLLFSTYISNLSFWISLGPQNNVDQQVLFLCHSPLPMSSSVLAFAGQGVSFPLSATATFPCHQAVLSFPLVRRGNIHVYISLYSLPCIFVPCSFVCHLSHSLSSKESWSFQSCFTQEFHMLLISLKDLTGKQRSYRMAKLMCYFKLLPCCKTAHSWASELTVHRWCYRQIEMITLSVRRYYSISVCQAEPWFISLNVFYISCVVLRWRGLNWTQPS